MKRLTEQNKNNSPESYDQVFQERAKSSPHWQDIRRWKELVRYYKGGKIIDMGCLDSEVCSIVHNGFWKEQNYRYLGTDVAKGAIGEMRKKYPYANSGGVPLVEFVVDDIYQSQIADNVADYVVLGEVLEHLSFPEHAIKESFRTLKPGGVLAISVPLEEANEPGAVDGDRHLWSFSKQDIEDLVKPYSSKVKFKVLRSKWFPRYSYCFPQLICWTIKK